MIDEDIIVHVFLCVCNDCAISIDGSVTPNEVNVHHVARCAVMESHAVESYFAPLLLLYVHIAEVRMCVSRFF